MVTAVNMKSKKGSKNEQQALERRSLKSIKDEDWSQWRSLFRKFEEQSGLNQKSKTWKNELLLFIIYSQNQDIKMENFRTKFKNFENEFIYIESKGERKIKSTSENNQIGKFVEESKFKVNKQVMKVSSEDLGKPRIFYLRNIHECQQQDRYVKDIYAIEVDTTISFLIDTGSDIDCIPFSQKLNKNINLQPNGNVIVKNASNQELEVMGTLHLTLQYNSRKIKSTVYVIQNLTRPLLGRLTSEKLRIVSICKISLSGRITTQVEPEKEFPKIFSSMGSFKGEVTIKLKEGSKPFAQTVPRPVPIPRLEPLEKELKKLQEDNIIAPIIEPTEWVSPIVVVPKDKDNIRLCVDFTKLNQSVLRPYFPITSPDSKFARIEDSVIFSKIDLNKGFHQVKLTEDCQKLTTFITPFGRFYYKRLPFGISSAPEEFVTRFAQILHDIPNIVFHVDEVLIFGKTVEIHDSTLRKVLKRLSEEGITLNKDKSIFGVTEIDFLGSTLSSKGVRISNERIKAITEFPQPKNKKDVQRFLGMVNFVSKYIRNKTDILSPMYELLKHDVEFIWNNQHEKSFKQVKEIVTGSVHLGFYKKDLPTFVNTDASNYGIGAFIYQIAENGEKQILSFDSRTLTDSEKRYAVIEKEALAITWACEKYNCFVNGITFVIETDHKPLIQILQTKNIDALTPRLQNFRLRLTRFDYSIQYVQGKNQAVSDCLSRAPIEVISGRSQLCQNYANAVIKSKPFSDAYLQKIVDYQNKDEICKTLINFVTNGWPTKKNVPANMKPYFEYRFDFSIVQNLLLKDTRIVIPRVLQNELLSLIHTGHFGITKCRRRANGTVWWIGLHSQLEKLITECNICIEHRKNPKEPHYEEEFPERPWQKIGADLFKSKKGIWYLIVTDYFSRFFEIFELKSLTEETVVRKFKILFSRYGIPDCLRSDNGPQFSGSKFKEFALKYNIIHDPSSPHYPQSNGEAESAVKVAKSLIDKNEDVLEALLAYRSTPLSNGYSPAELLMGRKLKTLLPTIPSNLNSSFGRDVIEKEEIMKSKQRENYNKRHKAVNLRELETQERVWVIDLKLYGVVIKADSSPRSYIVKCNNKLYRRNRQHLIPVKKDKPNNQVDLNIEEVLGKTSNSRSSISMQNQPSNVNYDIPPVDGNIRNVDDENLETETTEEEDQFENENVSSSISHRETTEAEDDQVENENVSSNIRPEEGRNINDDSQPRRSERTKTKTRFFGYF